MFGKNDFDDFEKKFNRDFNRLKVWGFVAGVFTLLVNLGILAFCIWVVIMLMRYFGVI